MDFLFDDAGSKLKKLAAVVFLAGTAVMVAFGIFLIAEEEFVTGLVVMILGAVISYVSALFLAAFGDLVENTELNWITNRSILEKLEAMEQEKQ